MHNTGHGGSGEWKEDEAAKQGGGLEMRSGGGEKEDEKRKEA